MDPDFDQPERMWAKLRLAAKLMLCALGGVILALGVLIWLAGYALAAPIAQARAEGTTVTLFDEPCTIAAVSNLQRRATWAEAGKVHEGCWTGQQGLVLLYFASDRTVVAIPAQAFERVTAS